MKIFCTFAIIIGCGTLAAAHPSDTDLQAIRDCFTQMPTATSYENERRIVTKCYDLARPYRRDNSVSARALYMQALSYFLKPDGTIDGYQKLNIRLSHYYNEYLKPKLTKHRLKQLTKQGLADAFGGIFYGTFYDPLVKGDGLGLKEAQDVFAELVVRGAATSDQATQFFHFLLAASEWQLASRLALAWPQISTLRSVVMMPLKSNDLGYFVLSTDLQAVTLVKADFGSGPRIVFNGDCHFAVDAIEQLSRHSDFVAAMRKYGIALASPDIDLSNLDSLRKQYPDFELHAVYKEADWIKQGYDVFFSPSFQFLQDGEIKYKFVGVGPHMIANFCAGLQSIGLSGLPSCNL